MPARNSTSTPSQPGWFAPIAARVRNMATRKAGETRRVSSPSQLALRSCCEARAGPNNRLQDCGTALHQSKAAARPALFLSLIPSRNQRRKSEPGILPCYSNKEKTSLVMRKRFRFCTARSDQQTARSRFQQDELTWMTPRTFRSH